MRLIDAISLKTFIKTHLPYSMPEGAMDAYGDVIQMLNDEEVTPTINLEDLRPKGKWIKIGEICGIDILECPVCHTYHTQNGDAFCRDCGADMRDRAKMEE